MDAMNSGRAGTGDVGTAGATEGFAAAAATVARRRLLIAGDGTRRSGSLD
jgi:hypothetical protein